MEAQADRAKLVGFTLVSKEPELVICTPQTIRQAVKNTYFQNKVEGKEIVIGKRRFAWCERFTIVPGVKAPLPTGEMGLEEYDTTIRRWMGSDEAALDEAIQQVIDSK